MIYRIFLSDDGNCTLSHVKRLYALFPLLVIIYFFLLFTTNPLWDPDFFVHLKTGEYIAYHKEIPKDDPFSYTTTTGETLRKKLFFGQYWLAQLSFYLVWKMAGTGGIIILRALVLSSILLVIYLSLRRKVEPFLLSVFIFFSGNVFTYFTGERPQLFSFLAVAILIFTVEHYKEKKGRGIYVLPFIILIWANLHGGVILGIALLLIYAFSEGLKFLFRFNSLGRKDFLRFLLVCIVSFAVSLVNPNIYNLFTVFYRVYMQPVYLPQEMFSPFTLAMRYKIIYYKYFLVIFLLVFTIFFVMLVKRRKIEPGYITVIIFLSAISVVSARYMIFPAIVFPLLAADISNIIQNRFNRIRLLCCAAMAVFMFYSLSVKDIFNFRIRETYPDKAVEFIKEVRPPGNLFNYFDWGGYLIAMLPEYKVFIDGR